MDWLTDPEALVALATLTVLEIVLGIDNIVFISILAAKLPEHQQAKARFIGLALAMIGRVGLLACCACTGRVRTLVACTRKPVRSLRCRYFESGAGCDC